MSKRVATITARDSNLRITVKVTIDGAGGLLNGAELTETRDELTDQIMRELPRLRFARFRLSRVQVR